MAHKHSVTENPVQLAGIAAIAAAIGATVAMLFTPRSGDQVRRGLSRRAQQTQDEIQSRLKRTPTDSAEEAKDDFKSRLQSTAEKVAEDVKSTTEKITDDTEATKRNASKAVEDIKNK